MSDFEVDAVIETTDGNDWSVAVVYEYDGQVKLCGVWAPRPPDGDEDFLADLTTEQYDQCLQAAIDDWKHKCDMACSMAEDAADMRAQAMRDERYENAQ